MYEICCGGLQIKALVIAMLKVTGPAFTFNRLCSLTGYLWSSVSSQAVVPIQVELLKCCLLSRQQTPHLNLLLAYIFYNCTVCQSLLNVMSSIKTLCAGLIISLEKELGPLIEELRQVVEVA